MHDGVRLFAQLLLKTCFQVAFIDQRLMVGIEILHCGDLLSHMGQGGKSLHGLGQARDQQLGVLSRQGPGLGERQSGGDRQRIFFNQKLGSFIFQLTVPSTPVAVIEWRSYK